MLTVQSTIIFNPQCICAQRVRVIGSAANLSYSSVFLRKNASSSTLRKFLQFVRKKQNGAASEKETGFFICFTFFVSYAYEMYRNFIPCACNLCIHPCFVGFGDVIFYNYLQKCALFRGEKYTNLEEGGMEGWSEGGTEEGGGRDEEGGGREGGEEGRREGGEDGGMEGGREGGREEGGVEGGMEGGGREGGREEGRRGTEEGVMEGGGEGHTIPGPDLLLHQPSSLMT